MKNLLLFFSLFTFFQSYAVETPIQVNITFEINSNRSFKHGILEIVELNKIININSTDDLIITLPKKGKYHLNFSTPNFKVNILSPIKISKNKNTIKISLADKSFYYIDKLLLSETLTNEEIKDKIESGEINFGINAISNQFNEVFKDFEKKYGISFVIENCASNPEMIERFNVNNKIIINYLNQNYGNDIWIDDLPISLLGQ